MKKSFWISCAVLLLCLILCEAVVLSIPKYYKSSFVVALSNEQKEDANQMITLSQPSDFNLGVSQKREVFRSEALSEILSSDAFLYALLQTEVRTLDGEFKGTLFAYLDTYQQKPFWSLKRDSYEEDKMQITHEDDFMWYSKKEATLIRGLRKSVVADMEYETRFVTVSCTATDPMVATMMARNTNQLLQEFLRRYEQERRQNVRLQFQNQLASAEHNLSEAVAQQRDDVAACQQIVDALRRQEMLFDAQIKPSEMCILLSEPTVDYRKAGPSRWKMPLLITVLLGAALLAWNKRKNIVRFFHED